MPHSVYTVINYGVVKKGLWFKVLNELRDSYLVKCHGSPVYIPKYITGYPREEREILQTEEEDVE